MSETLPTPESPDLAPPGVCTHGMFLDRAPPLALALTEHWRVVEFE